MALTWDWTDIMGEYTMTHGEYTDTGIIYQGNAQMIGVYHNDDKHYTLQWFSGDKNHLRNMLGLNKGYERCFEEFGFTKLRLNTRYKSVAQIVSDLAKAKCNLTIELYYE